jgi:hypothetical protein
MLSLRIVLKGGGSERGRGRKGRVGETIQLQASLNATKRYSSDIKEALEHQEKRV